jgi:2-amino-4-hydroxy-6-hydroxymethyldihydropteridine diphosphokinase
MKKTAFIGIGSNQGLARENCQQAVKEIGSLEKVWVETNSSLYETAPLGIENQDWFINSVIKIKTTLLPLTLLDELLGIEEKMGRVRRIKWGPRIIDLDLLFYEDSIINEANLTVPHPELHKRKFVLEPLKEITPKLLHPILKKTIEELARESDPTQIVNKLTPVL